MKYRTYKCQCGKEFITPPEQRDEKYRLTCPYCQSELLKVIGAYWGIKEAFKNREDRR